MEGQTFFFFTGSTGELELFQCFLLKRMISIDKTEDLLYI